MNAKDGFVGKKEEINVSWRVIREYNCCGYDWTLINVWLYNKDDITIYNVYTFNKICINKSHQVWTDFTFNEKQCLNENLMNYKCLFLKI